MSMPDRLLTTSEVLNRIRAILDQDIPEGNKLVGIEWVFRWNRRYHNRPRVDVIREELHLKYGITKTELKEVDDKIIPFLKSIEDETTVSTSPYKTFYYHYFSLYYILRFHKSRTRPGAIKTILAEAKEKYYEALQSKRITLPKERSAIQALDKLVKKYKEINRHN